MQLKGQSPCFCVPRDVSSRGDRVKLDAHSDSCHTWFAIARFRQGHWLKGGLNCGLVPPACGHVPTWDHSSHLPILLLRVRFGQYRPVQAEYDRIDYIASPTY
jgi:hypothetical protein